MFFSAIFAESRTLIVLSIVAQFGEKIKDLDPTVYYNFMNPPIKIPNKDKVIFVVHIPRSTNTISMY